MNGDLEASRDTPARPSAFGPDLASDLDDRAAARGLALFKGSLGAGILWTNEALDAIVGFGAGPTRGWDWLQAVHEDDRARLRRALEAAGASGSRSAFPVRIQVRPGVIEQVRVVVAGIDRPGVTGYFACTLDLPPPASVTAAPAEAPVPPVPDPGAVDPYEVLLDALPHAVAYVASDGAIEFANAAWTDWTASRVGDHLADVFDDSAAESAEPLEAAVERAEEWRGVVTAADARHAVVCTPIAAAIGGGAVVVLSEATKDERPLAAVIEPFRRLIDATPDCGAILSPEGELLAINDASRRMLGVDADAEPPAGLLETLWFDDAEGGEFGERVRHALTSKDWLVSTGRIHAGDGRDLPATMLVFSIRDDAGMHRASLCIARDETEVHAARSRVEERDEWFAALVQHSSMMVAVLDAQWNVAFVSPACRDLFGFDLEETLGAHSAELVHSEDRDLVRDTILDVHRSGGSATVRYRILRGDDELRHVETRIDNLLDDPVVAGIVFTTRDVTDEARATEARAQSEAALRTLVQSAPVAILATDSDGALQVWNPGCELLFGWSADEVIGRPAPFLSESQWESAAFVEVTERLLAGERFEATARLHRRDGEEIVVALATSPVGTEDDPARTFVTVAVDVTPRERVTEELARHSEVDRFVASLTRTLVDATCETIERRVVAALNALVQRLDARAAAIAIGADAEARFASSELSGDLAVDPTVSGAFVESLEDRDRGGWTVVGEQGAVGRVVVEWDAASGITTDELQPLEVVAASLVMAIDRADADRERRDREERLRALAEHATDLVVVLGDDRQLRYLSPATGRFLGMQETDRFDPEESVVHADDRANVLTVMNDVVTAGPAGSARELVARLRRADGEYRWLEMVVSNLTGVAGVDGIVINGRDVTERFEMAARIRDSERELRGILQNLGEGVIVLDADGDVKYASPTAASFLGLEPHEGRGRPGLDFVVAEDQDRVAEILARAYTEPGLHGPIQLRVHGVGGVIRTLEATGHNGLDDPDVRGVIVTTRDVTDQLAAEEAAERSGARLSALVEKVSDVITIVGRDGEIVYTSPAANRLFGFEEGDESHTDPMARIHPEDRDVAVATITEHLAAGSTEPVRFRLQAADGTWHWVETVVQDLTGDESVGGLVVTTRDISDRYRAEEIVADQAEVLTLIARGAPLRETLEAVCTVLERDTDEMFGVFLIGNERRQVRLISGPSMPVELADSCRDLAMESAASILGAALDGERSVREVDPDAVTLPEVVLARQGVQRVTATPIMDSVGRRVIGVVAALSREGAAGRGATRALVEMFAQTAAIAVERWAAEELLAHRANHDSLTGLPNRVLFLEFLARSLARSARDGSTLAVLFMDLDRFKHVNDGLGHDSGDVLLRILADRLRDQMRPSDVVARFGGDEFTVLCEGLDPERATAQVQEVAERLLETVEVPVSFDGEDRRLSASLGIAIANPQSTPDSILRDADAAMYEAKQHGKARYEIFDDAMRSTMHRRLDLEARLERAIHNDEFRLFLQPIVDLRTGRCIGGEALLRWQDPQLGLVTPDVFIGLAEDTGLIIPMGEWALAEACRTVARWEQVGLLPPDFTMAVNLSARQVAQADLVRRVADVIERNGGYASRLCLEITETVLMEESAVDVMSELKALGVRLSIDDFGTGYSSLGYLKRFPVDSVKVDRSFIDGLGTEGEDSAIVAAVVSLGHALGLSVVAEGVETSGQLRALVELGCDRAQGYWFSGPRTAFEFAGLLNEQPWENGQADWGA